MALSGYMFPSPSSILPYLEPQRIGPTALLCRELARRLGCCVIAGYPEALPSGSSEEAGDGDDGETEPRASGSRISTPRPPSSVPDTDRGKGGGDSDLKDEALGVGYNSALVVDKWGEVVGNYRKTFRFETDKNWAREGEV